MLKEASKDSIKFRHPGNEEKRVENQWRIKKSGKRNLWKKLGMVSATTLLLSNKAKEARPMKNLKHRRLWRGATHSPRDEVFEKMDVASGIGDFDRPIN